MSKSKRRKAQSANRQQKRSMTGGGKSKYAIKHAEQARGKFRPTSPFYLTPSELASIEASEAARSGAVAS